MVRILFIMMKNLRMYKGNGEFKEQSAQQEKKLHEPVILERRNIDGSTKVCISMFYFKIPKHIPVGESVVKNIGLDCSFYNMEEAVTCLKVAIENTTFADLIVNKEIKCLSILSLKYHINSVEQITFTLQLHISHDQGTGIIESNHPNIIHLLLKGKPYKSNSLNLPFYVAQYNARVNMRIRQLVEQQKNNTFFPYGVVTCYRRECSSDTFFIKGTEPHITCTGCQIAEICELCCSNSHPGTSCNTNSDESIRAYLESNKNTVVCPGCTHGIEKTIGCNHIECRACNTDFCFLCGFIFENHDAISPHYVDRSSFSNICYGNIHNISQEALGVDGDNEVVDDHI